MINHIYHDFKNRKYMYIVFSIGEWFIGASSVVLSTKMPGVRGVRGPGRCDMVE